LHNKNEVLHFLKALPQPVRDFSRQEDKVTVQKREEMERQRMRQTNQTKQVEVKPPCRTAESSPKKSKHHSTVIVKKVNRTIATELNLKSPEI